MFRARVVFAVTLLATLLAVPACSSMGESRKQDMLDSAPVGYEVQLITLRVTDTRYGRVTVEQTIVDLLARREGILDVRRGSGVEELYVLAEAHVDPYALARNVRERFIVRVLDVEKPGTEIDLPEAGR